MKIEIRLFATLRKGRGKKVELDCQEGELIHTLLDRLEIQPEEVAILLKNGRDASLDDSLAEGDYLSIFPPVGGG